jgi:hypothetical protein
MKEKVQVLLSEEEIDSLVSALTFAYNNGNTADEFGDFSLLQKLKEIKAATNQG